MYYNLVIVCKELYSFVDVRIRLSILSEELVFYQNLDAKLNVFRIIKMMSLKKDEETEI